MTWIDRIRRVLQRMDEGQSVIEYALVVAMVSVVVVGGLFAMANSAMTEISSLAIDRLADALP